MKRAAIYARTSTQLQENEKTIESQIAALEIYAKENGYTITAKYTDDGYSGALLARPALDKLRDDVSKDIFESVIIYDTSRLSRIYAHQAILTMELEDARIEVIFLDSPKVQDIGGRMMNGFKGLFAEYEREIIKERTRRGRLHRANQGKLVGHEAPFGYRYVRPDPNKEERYYKVLDEEAKIVQMIFEWVGNEKCSLTEVRRRLHDKQIKTRSGNKTIWSNSTLSRLLRRTDYIGKSFYNKTLSVVPAKPRIDGYRRMKKTGRKYKPQIEWLPIKNVPPIVADDLFYRTQKQLRNNVFFCKRNQKFPYLLSGLLFCGCGCESRMAGDGQGGQNKYRYYRSTDRIRRFPEKRICTAFSVPADKIEQLVWDHIVKFLNNPKLVLKQLKDIENKRIKEHEQLKNTILDIEKRAEKINTEEERVATAYRKGFLTLEQLNIQMKDIDKQREQLNENEKNTLAQSPNADIQVTPEAINHYCEIMRKKLPEITLIEKQELLRLLINKVIVKNKTIIIQGEIPIENTLQLNHASQSQFSSSSGFRRSSSGGGSRCLIPFPSILYNCRIAGQGSRRSKRACQICHS